MGLYRNWSEWTFLYGQQIHLEQPTKIGDLGTVAALVAMVMLQQHVAALQICAPDTGAVSNCPTMPHCEIAMICTASRRAIGNDTGAVEF